MKEMKEIDELATLVKETFGEAINDVASEINAYNNNQLQIHQSTRCDVEKLDDGSYLLTMVGKNGYKRAAYRDIEGVTTAIHNHMR